MPTSEDQPPAGALWGYLRTHTNPPVFILSVVLVLAFLAAGVVFTGTIERAANAVLDFITGKLGWFYILAATFFLVFVLGVMLSRYGRLRLGPDNSRPEYRTLPWFAMLFTAGMGIGLVFYGVYEAPYHLRNAPISAAGEQEAGTQAMNYTIFHWGLHPWAIYIVLGLSMGYFCFRKGLPLRPASGFYPLIGDRIHGWVGNLIDVLAVFGTLFGLATSLGLGAQQVNAGLSEVFGLSINPTMQVAIIALITAVAVVSVMLGINKGIRRLSVVNLGLALLVMAFIFAVGPKLYILTGLADYTGFYLQNLVGTSFEVFNQQAEPEAASWQAEWTLFYWGWWMSWSPFVGMFIARISYGRTIREFIGGTLFAPVGASIVWFTVLGGTGLRYQLDGKTDIAGGAPESALFTLVGELPIGTILAVLVSLLTVLVVTLFFATSSDSGSLVVDMLTNGGDPHPVRGQRMFWAVTEGAVAAVLLWIGGSTALDALQSAAITAGLPFAVVLLCLCAGLAKAFRDERLASAPSASRLATPDARAHDLSEREPVTDSATGAPARRPRGGLSSRS
ncbi:BCCT family transporter [Amycolatopsis cihanbeyliensis]|uniref:Choline/glycine/proline betaine transport protein n=1 Tax=Amycolatopsis cihanbeyliensis TaxID=1128664 RepID=A0A542CS98_AMYCI|nr:BCCT family transporter [Amycolatopsis cihanbeyliensis]TQI93699.1 choline/glycine/proline betaine transport protein [Amycolatopsis cihanbeyliensis]